MLLLSTKAWMPLLLAFSAIPTALSAPSPVSLDLKAAEDVSSPDALFPRDISYAMAERDAVPDHLDKRTIITSPNTRRVVNLKLKQAVHGFAAGTQFTWNIVYHWVSNINGKEGKIEGYRDAGSDGHFAFSALKVDHVFSNAIDAIITGLFDVVDRSNQKFEMKIVWEEEFKSTGAAVQRFLNSYVTFFTAGGAQEHLSQDQFEFNLD